MPFYIIKNIQEHNNIIALNIEILNEELNLTIIIILITLIIIIFIIIKKTSINSIKILKENEILESFWTIVPSIIILRISLPSIICLYYSEEINKPNNHILITGNQWYWSYKKRNNISFNSYIFNSLINRNLSTDYSVLIKNKKITQILFSSNDVIHSWTIPSINLKIDCIPGRINRIIMKTNKRIKIKGQCSEICGANHRFIPISIIVLSLKKNNFLN